MTSPARFDQTLHGVPSPFALAAEETHPMPAREQETLARQLAQLRRGYVQRGWAATTLERASFHRCVAYDREASDVGLYLREATRAK
jgi:single-stranded DNA-binding protein